MQNETIAYRNEQIKKSFVKVEAAFRKFKEDIVSKIDQGDNCGYNDVVGFRENYAIKQFNANWYEIKTDHKIQDVQFEKAIQYATLVFDNWIRKLYGQIEMPDKEKTIFEDAIKNSEDGIAVLTENFFYTNVKDTEFMLSEEGMDAIADAHVEGILAYCEMYA